MAFTVEGLHLPLKLPIDSFTPAELPDLTPQLLLNLEAAGYGPPTPLQRHTVPVAFAARDLLVMGATHGTGLTVSLLLPIVGRLARDPRAVAAQRAADGASRPRALVLAADREGATHALDVARELARRTPLRALACGGIQSRTRSPSSPPASTSSSRRRAARSRSSSAGGSRSTRCRSSRSSTPTPSSTAASRAPRAGCSSPRRCRRRAPRNASAPRNSAAAQFGRRAIRPPRNSACNPL